MSVSSLEPSSTRMISKGARGPARQHRPYSGIGVGELVVTWHHHGYYRLPLDGHIELRVPLLGLCHGFGEALRLAARGWHGPGQNRAAVLPLFQQSTVEGFRENSDQAAQRFGFVERFDPRAKELGDVRYVHVSVAVRVDKHEGRTRNVGAVIREADPEAVAREGEKMIPEDEGEAVAAGAHTGVREVLAHDVRGGPCQDGVALHEFHHDAALDVGHVMRPAFDLFAAGDVDVSAEQT
jgi:hypothetical protein